MINEPQIKNMRRINRIHLIGIGGAGMGGIAEVLHNLGYQISGSDPAHNNMITHLKALGIPINHQHEASNVESADVVVVSSAIAANNVEVLKAKECRIPVVQRATMLAELMRFKEGIAIAGAHGKTTTTSLVTSLLAEAGLDPTYVIGGRLNSHGRNARLGTGRFFVAEADESDASFLHLMPMISIVTNIDKDHLEAYQHDFAILKNSYIQFLHQLPFYGLAIVCIDDPEIASILPEIARPLITYGFSENADVKAHQFVQKYNQSHFQVERKDRPLLSVILNLPGKHNVLNALAAIAVATELGLSDKTIVNGLEQFQGVGRRFNILGKLMSRSRQVLLIDDYGHHPKEVEVVLEAIRNGWQEKRVVMVYQPHRYSRTKALFEDFVNILSTVDVLILLEVYSAGEAAIPSADSRTLAFSIRSRGRIDPVFVSNKMQLYEVLADLLQDDDVLLMQGAGDIGALSQEIASEGLSTHDGDPLRIIG